MQELWTKCLPGISNQNEVGLKIASGKRLAVDVSGWLHRLVNRESNALLLASEPSCPPYNVVRTMSEWHNVLLHHKIIPMCVFDGSPHPMKRDTNAERKLIHSKAEQELQECCDKGRTNQEITEEDYEKLENF